MVAMAKRVEMDEMTETTTITDLAKTNEVFEMDEVTEMGSLTFSLLDTLTLYCNLAPSAERRTFIPCCVYDCFMNRYDLL